jgi:Holliday junction resolvase RusA-like endonuclease
MRVTLSIVIPGAPAAKGRPRMTRTGHAYTPAKTRQAERNIVALFVQKYPDHAILEGPLEVEIIASFAIPKSASKATAREMRGQRILPTKRPDCDNIAKLIDSLNGVCWRDDAQVVSLMVIKQYDDRPRTEIKVRPAGDEP